METLQVVSGNQADLIGLVNQARVGMSLRSGTVEGLIQTLAREIVIGVDVKGIAELPHGQDGLAFGERCIPALQVVVD